MHWSYTDEMRLPGYKDALIPDEKTIGYALNMEHSTGKHKAIVFEKVLGYNSSNKEQLIKRVRRGLVDYRRKQD